LFYKFKRLKELNSSIVSRGVLLHYNKRLFIIQMDGDDAIKIFRINKSGVLGEVYNIIKIKIY
jgi:hypothetical protein